MNHDITHCSGHDLMGTTLKPVVCEKRDTCHRYLAYLDAKATNCKLFSSLMPSYCMNEDHNMYWPEEQKGGEPCKE